MAGEKQGFLEVEHTADWELQVWAPNLNSLFEQAAAGMYLLSGTVLDKGERVVRAVKLEAPDAEALLVSFLSELLFWGETEGLGFDEFSIQVTAGGLQGEVQGSKIKAQEKEIKAVTFHQMHIRESSRGLEVNIVFDV
jgi:SHS2 domain-containing protein